MRCHIVKNTLLHTAFSAILPAGVIKVKKTCIFISIHLIPLYLLKFEFQIFCFVARPEAPVVANIKVVSTVATVFWNRLPGRNDINHYDVYLTQLGVTPVSVEQFKTSSGLEDSYTFEDLKKGYFYEFKIRGVVGTDEMGKWLTQTFYVPSGKHCFFLVKT